MGTIEELDLYVSNFFYQQKGAWPFNFCDLFISHLKSSFYHVPGIVFDVVGRDDTVPIFGELTI